MGRLITVPSSPWMHVKKPVQSSHPPAIHSSQTPSWQLIAHHHVYEIMQSHHRPSIITHFLGLSQNGSSPLLHSGSTTLELSHLTQNKRLVGMVLVRESSSQNPVSATATRSSLVDERVDITDGAGSVEPGWESRAVCELDTKSESWLRSIDDRLNSGYLRAGACACTGSRRSWSSG